MIRHVILQRRPTRFCHFRDSRQRRKEPINSLQKLHQFSRRLRCMVAKPLKWSGSCHTSPPEHIFPHNGIVIPKPVHLCTATSSPASSSLPRIASRASTSSVGSNLQHTTSSTYSYARALPCWKIFGHALVREQQSRSFCALTEPREQETSWSSVRFSVEDVWRGLLHYAGTYC